MLFSLLCQQALKRKGRPSGLIGQYKPYLNSNDSPTREVLKDYSGNGHDIQLYNFAFAESSGYGKYNINWLGEDYKSYSARADLEVSTSKVVVKSYSGHNGTAFIENISESYKTPSYRIKVSGLSGTGNILYVNYENKLSTRILITQDGEYVIPASSVEAMYSNGLGFQNSMESCNIVIEQIPEYQGALVSDGVDDYGLCENFPILTKERGYTVCALRKILKPFEEIQVNACLLSNYNNSETGSFYIENRANNSWSTYSFGGITNSLDVDYNNDFVFQTSLSYNNYPINKGENTNSINRLYLFRLASWTSSHLPSALYALEIYDRDLTESEIARVKERMIKQYELKTGQKYEEA